MAEITTLPDSADLRAHCIGLSDSELLAQQLVQQGAVHALTTLISLGCNEANAAAMLASLNENDRMIADVAKARGVSLLFHGGGGK